MNPVLESARGRAFAAPTPRATLSCEDPLRVAAATLANAPRTEITATTVVGVLGHDDVGAFQALLSRISDEYELEARARTNVGSYSVRFSRRVDICGSKTHMSPTAAHQPQSAPAAVGPVGRIVEVIQSWVYRHGRQSQRN